MGAETPGATPGQSTRMWDATPGHTTPAAGAATPGRDTPGHVGASQTSVRRNRWDETPKTERGIFKLLILIKKHFFQLFIFQLHLAIIVDGLKLLVQTVAVLI